MELQRCARIILPAFVMLLTSGLASGLEVPVLDDADVRQATAGQHFGIAPALSVHGTSGSTRYTYMKFNAASYLPAGFTSGDITQATLLLYVRSVTTAGSFRAYSVTGSWSEGKVTGASSPGDISWNDQPSASATVLATVSISGSNENDYIALDVTELVKDWVDNPAQNYGLVFKPFGTSLVMHFSSKESDTATHWPRLNVTFAKAGEPGTKWLTGTSAPGSGVGVDGDFYLNTATSQYYIKTAGVWGSPTSLVGTSGANGSKWLSGNGAPNAGVGVDGDFYLDLTASVYYGPKASGAWPGAGISIIGTTGATGPQGPATVRIQAGGDLSMGDFQQGQQP